jgi:hypothetical protein
VWKLDIAGLHVYMDDYFDWDFQDSMLRYRGVLRPHKQIQLLVLWEAIGCPFNDAKQLSGSPLKIIGFWVNVNVGTISLDPSSISSLTTSIQTFLGTPSRQPPLRDWWRLAGHLNWLLNVLPWGRPALTKLYRKMAGKTQGRSGVFINAEVRRDLLWLSDTIPVSIGVRFMDEGMWEDKDADMVIWTDASLHGALSFVTPGNGWVYKLRKPPPGVKVNIFFLELCAILSAITHELHSTPPCEDSSFGLTALTL